MKINKGRLYIYIYIWTFFAPNENSWIHHCIYGYEINPTTKIYGLWWTSYQGGLP